MKSGMTRLPSPREYQLLTFAEKRKVIDQIDEVIFTYAATERGNNEPRGRRRPSDQDAGA